MASIPKPTAPVAGNFLMAREWWNFFSRLESNFNIAGLAEQLAAIQKELAELSKPGQLPVKSVNGKYGAVILDADDVGADPSGTAAAAVAAHVAAADPHPQYTTEAEAAAAAPVQSVNTKTGDVMLDASDVGADPAGSAAAALSAANEFTIDEVATRQEAFPDTFYIDPVNKRIGVGTQSPIFQFHVEGSTAGLYLNRLGGSESFISLAMDGVNQGQIRAAAGGYLKVTNALGNVEHIRLAKDLGVRGGRLYGTALHNNPDGIAGTAEQYVGSGTYTPTITGVANVDASTAFTCQFLRVGNVVTVSGAVNVDTNAASVLTTVGISLPIASDLSSYLQCCGVASGSGVGYIQGDVTNDRANLSFTVATTDNRAWFFNFTYLVR